MPLEELVTRAQQGDRGALERVDARDATQEILVRVITHLGSFRGESSFRSKVDRQDEQALRKFYGFFEGTLSSFNFATISWPEEAGFTALSIVVIFPSGPM